MEVGEIEADCVSVLLDPMHSKKLHGAPGLKIETGGAKSFEIVRSGSWFRFRIGGGAFVPLDELRSQPVVTFVTLTFTYGC